MNILIPGTLINLTGFGVFFLTHHKLPVTRNSSWKRFFIAGILSLVAVTAVIYGSSITIILVKEDFTGMSIFVVKTITSLTLLLGVSFLVIYKKHQKKFDWKLNTLTACIATSAVAICLGAVASLIPLLTKL